jgi:predicted transcriptional regulator
MFSLRLDAETEAALETLAADAPETRRERAREAIVAMALSCCRTAYAAALERVRRRRTDAAE